MHANLVSILERKPRQNMNLYKDKHIYLPLFAVVAVIVGFRAWQDMHPAPKPPKDFFDTNYMVHNDQQMAPFTTDPDDQRDLVIDIGEIRTGKDGAVTLTPAPVTPITLPQREIILVASYDTLPNSLEAMGPLLAKAADKWRDAGDIVNDIYLKGPQDKKSVAAAFDQVNALRESLQNEYWLGFFVDRAALDSLPGVREKIEEAGKSMRTLVYTLKEAQRPGEKLEEMITKIDHDYEAPFMVKVNQLPDFKALREKLKPEPERFVGFILDAGDKPPPALKASDEGK